MSRPHNKYRFILTWHGKDGKKDDKQDIKEGWCKRVDPWEVRYESEDEALQIWKERLMP